MRLISFLSFILLLHTGYLQAQQKYGQLKVKTPLHNIYWDKVEVIGTDRIYRSPVNNYTNQNEFDSLPYGHYVVRLSSVFSDIVEEPIEVDGKAVLKFKLDRFYSMDTGTTSLIDKMTPFDTLWIFLINHACFNGGQEFSFIVKTESGVILHYPEGAGFGHLVLDSGKINFIRSYDTASRSEGIPIHRSTTHTAWHLELNNKVIIFSESGSGSLTKWKDEGKR